MRRVEVIDGRLDIVDTEIEDREHRRHVIGLRVHDDLGAGAEFEGEHPHLPLPHGEPKSVSVERESGGKVGHGKAAESAI